MRPRWLLAAGAAALALVACARASRDPLLTYFNADHGLSLRHPWHWSSDQADQDGVWYRYFQSPPDAERGSVTVTLLVSPLAGPLDGYARTYLAGAGAPQVADEARPGLVGRGWRYTSADGARRHRLLLLRDSPGGGPGGRVVGLHAEGAPALLEANAAFVDEMFASLAAERAELYREYRDPRQGFVLRVPPSWAEARHFGGADQALVQFTTPALAADRTRQTVHGSLTVTSERVVPGTTQRSYYDNGRLTLGEALQVVSHGPWKSGFVDSVRAETSMASARQKRYVVVSGGRGYSLVFEAREDAFHRMARWCDLVAATFQADGEPAQP